MSDMDLTGLNSQWAKVWTGWEAPEETPYLFQILEVPTVLGSWPLPPSSQPPVLYLSDPSLFREFFVVVVCIFVCCFQVCLFVLSYHTACGIL